MSNVVKTLHFRWLLRQFEPIICDVLAHLVVFLFVLKLKYKIDFFFADKLSVKLDL